MHPDLSAAASAYIQSTMSVTTAVRERPLPGPTAAEPRRRSWRPRQVAWLAAGFVLAFAVPFVFADTLALPRDLYYGAYVASVLGFVAAWARDSGFGRATLTRNWRWGLALGFAAALALMALVLRSEEATERPDGLRFAGALLWRGVVYGVADGVLLSAFPILAVFAALSALRRSRAHTVGVAAVALAASLAMTAVYHLGYSDFRSTKLRKPVAGDVVWSAPTLLTLSPLGAPIAHAGLHVAAVVHSYETDTFLPPHAAGTGPRRTDVSAMPPTGTEVRAPSVGSWPTPPRPRSSSSR